jgi:hypothetical protein
MKANVMDTIQGKLPSQAKKMSVMDVLRSFAAKNIPPDERDGFLGTINAVCSFPNVRLIHINNSVFFTIKNSKDTVEFQIISTEDGNSVANNIMGYMKFLKNQNVKTAIVKTNSGEMVTFLKMLPLKMNVSQGTKVGGGIAKPVYIVQIEVGEN